MSTKRLLRTPKIGWFLLAVATLPLLVLLPAGSAFSAPTSPHKISVHDCHSSYGVHTTFPSKPLSPITTSLPNALYSKVSFVTDTAQNISPILTITNWSCSFGVGADGTWALASTSNTNPTDHIDVTDPMITAGVAWGLLCHLYPAIDSLYPGEGCPSAPTHVERVTKRAPGVTYFTDPAGAVGTAPGSGGRLATMGVAIYYGRAPSTKERTWGYGIVMGCTLPASQEATCRTLLENFASHH